MSGVVRRDQQLVSTVGGILVTVATVAVAVGSSTVTNFADIACGRSARSGRIVGGREATPGEFPWLVSLTKRGGHYCGGTVLNSRWVLTAAHCLCSSHLVIDASELRVIVGGHDLRDPPSWPIPVRNLYLHPSYTCNRHQNDIALLELSKDIAWSDKVRPACLPAGYPGSFSDVSATAAGWGWTAELTGQGEGGRANTLQKVELKVVNNQQCQAWYKSMGKKVRIHDSQMCAGFEQGGKDSCWADSGGPLMVEGESIMVIGIVSTGIGCARPKLPGLYTRISHYVNWIGETLRK